ncbi:MAG: azurin [Oligoflexales bacterium]
MLKNFLAILCIFVSHLAYGLNCSVTIEANDMMRYSSETMSINKKCKNVKVILKNVGKLPKVAMGHNWVLSKTSDMQAVSTEALKAGAAKEYTPEGSKVIAKTKLLGGGEQDEVSFNVEKLNKDEQYTYFCTFPGHSSLMKGTFKFTETGELHGKSNQKTNGDHSRKA